MRLHHRRGWRAATLGVAIAACGIAGTYAWGRGLWGLLTGATLAAVWLTALAWWNAAHMPAPPAPDGPAGNGDAQADRATMQRLLLDAAPTPLLAIDGNIARALNRAGRSVFGTDDRIVPSHPALLHADTHYLHHEGRRWRIDRVATPAGSTVAALIDVEREESAAQARASAELIEVLGHELLNGLAPIVSLAESAQAAASSRPFDPVLLEEILGPLARRAEGLQRFASAYRDLARLPEPSMAPVSLEAFAQDLAHAFVKRWPAIALTVTTDIGAPADLQLHGCDDPVTVTR